MNEPAFTVRPKGARICAALVLASAAVRLTWFLLAHGAGTDAYTAIVHLALPELSCILLAVFILRGALRLCTIPVGLGCLFFVLKAACLFGAEVCSSSVVMREVSEGVSVGENNRTLGIACGAAQFIAGAAIWRTVCALLLKGLRALKKRLG